MNREFAVELLIALAGFLLIIVTGVLGFSLLTWLGIWLVLGALFWHLYREYKKARKQGKEVFY